MPRALDAHLLEQWKPDPQHPDAYVSKTDANTFLADTGSTRHYTVLSGANILLVCSVGDHWHFCTQQTQYWFQQRMKSSDAATELWDRIGRASSKLDHLVLDICFIQNMLKGKDISEEIARQVAPSYQAWRAAQPNADQLPATVEARLLPVARTTAAAAIKEVVRLTHPQVTNTTRGEFLKMKPERRAWAPKSLHGNLKHPDAGKTAPAVG